MIITVTAGPGASGVLETKYISFDCALGRTGVTSNKREGDGATPSGKYPIRQLLDRPDRVTPPNCLLPTRSLRQHDGWCDDPSDSDYNRLVSYPYRASAETLWRDDGVYDLILVIGYNDAPTIPGRGSAIFLHCAAPDMAPTEGCIALTQEDFLTLAALLEIPSFLEILAP